VCVSENPRLFLLLLLRIKYPSWVSLPVFQMTTTTEEEEEEEEERRFRVDGHVVRTTKITMIMINHQLMIITMIMINHQLMIITTATTGGHRGLFP
jgi:hypothetical protein